MINILFDRDSFKILTLFSLSPGSRFKRNEIKQNININNVPLDYALLRLIRSNILKREGNLYSLNFENKEMKEIVNIIERDHIYLKRIPIKIYFLILDLISDKILFKDCELYLFGSYSKLVYNDKSDIDIAILTSKDLKKDLLNKLIKKLEKRYNKAIEVHFFDKNKFYKNKKDPLVKDIIKNGVKLC